MLIMIWLGTQFCNRLEDAISAAAIAAVAGGGLCRCGATKYRTLAECQVYNVGRKV